MTPQEQRKIRMQALWSIKFDPEELRVLWNKLSAAIEDDDAAEIPVPEAARTALEKLDAIFRV